MERGGSSQHYGGSRGEFQLDEEEGPISQSKKRRKRTSIKGKNVALKKGKKNGVGPRFNQKSIRPEGKKVWGKRELITVRLRRGDNKAVKKKDNTEQMVKKNKPSC